MLQKVTNLCMQPKSNQNRIKIEIESKSNQNPHRNPNRNPNRNPRKAILREQESPRKSLKSRKSILNPRTSFAVPRRQPRSAPLRSQERGFWTHRLLEKLATQSAGWGQAVQWPESPWGPRNCEGSPRTQAFLHRISRISIRFLLASDLDLIWILISTWIWFDFDLILVGF